MTITTAKAPIPTDVAQLPKGARDLLELAQTQGWRSAWGADTDTEDNPFVSVALIRRAPEWEVRVTWHTRATRGKSFRLFSMIWRHVPLEGRGHYWQDIPSLRALRQTIQDNPVRR